MYTHILNFSDMEFLEVLTEGLERVLMVRGGGGGDEQGACWSWWRPLQPDEKSSEEQEQDPLRGAWH